MIEATFMIFLDQLKHELCQRKTHMYKLKRVYREIAFK